MNKYIFDVDIINTETITVECNNFVKATELVHETIKKNHPCDRYEVKDFKRIKQ